MLLSRNKASRLPLRPKILLSLLIPKRKLKMCWELQDSILGRRMWDQEFCHLEQVRTLECILNTDQEPSFSSAWSKHMYIYIYAVSVCNNSLKNVLENLYHLFKALIYRLFVLVHSCGMHWLHICFYTISTFYSNH